MPIWEDEGQAVTAQARSVTQQVRAGNALPIFSQSAMFDLALFGYDSFLGYYAGRIGYPYPNLPDVGQLANYDRYTNRNSDVECKDFYLNCFKNHIFREAKAAGLDADTLDAVKDQVDQVGVSAFANLLGYPRFDQPQTRPLQVVANLPFKTYLTISATTFLEDALRHAGRDPVTKMCRWRGPVDAPEKELWLISDSYTPSTQQPLVFHLCGLDAHPTSKVPLPDSLALTQDDHLELLVNLAQDRGKDSADRLPALVRGALFDDVVLLGFSLDSWAFRALYYGLIGRPATRRIAAGCAVCSWPRKNAPGRRNTCRGTWTARRTSTYSGAAWSSMRRS